MLIINQNYTKGTTDASRSKIRIEKKNDMYCLLINNEIYAESEDNILIDILYFRLMQFKEQYKRVYDTFDINKEIEIINNQLIRNDISIDHLFHYASHTS